jgi:cytidine deaminase
MRGGSPQPLPDEQRLIEAAWAARQHALAGISGFRVGAALLLAGGDVVTGCNVENATLGLTMCAERVALLKALSDGAELARSRAVAVVAESAVPTPPCGACRQLLWEFCGDIPVICANAAGTARHTVGGLLPEAFDASFLRDPA